jgi:hypothetical protein
MAKSQTEPAARSRITGRRQISAGARTRSLADDAARAASARVEWSVGPCRSSRAAGACPRRGWVPGADGSGGTECRATCPEDPRRGRPDPVRHLQKPQARLGTHHFGHSGSRKHNISWLPRSGLPQYKSWTSPEFRPFDRILLDRGLLPSRCRCAGERLRPVLMCPS